MENKACGNCDNCKAGFNCMIDWEKKFPGARLFSCSWCGIYKSSQPRCNECEEST